MIPPVSNYLLDLLLVSFGCVSLCGSMVDELDMADEANTGQGIEPSDPPEPPSFEEMLETLYGKGSSERGDGKKPTERLSDRLAATRAQRL
jgi:hypothetical protein